MNNNKYLVVVRAGDNSLHPHWLGPDKNFDVVVSYYGDNPDPFPEQDIILYPCKGSKWQGLYHTLKNIDVDWRSYRYIWLPDDDILTDCKNINKFFEIVNKLNCVLAQPALTHDSYYFFEVLLQDFNFMYRKTNFVETMVPCFRVDTLVKCLETFNESFSGWGIDLLWWRIIDPVCEDIIVVDDTPVKHTREVSVPGVRGSGSGTGIPGYNSLKDLDEIVKKYRIISTPIYVHYGMGYDGRKTYTKF